MPKPIVRSVRLSDYAGATDYDAPDDVPTGRAIRPIVSDAPAPDEGMTLVQWDGPRGDRRWEYDEDITEK